MKKDVIEGFKLNIPTQLIFGCGRSSEIGEFAALFGRRILLVTMPDLEELGYVS